MGWAKRRGSCTELLYKTVTSIDLKYYRGTAFHEAGHAVIGLLLGIEVRWVTIVPTAGGVCCGRVYWFPKKRQSREFATAILAASWAESIAHDPPHMPRVVQTLSGDTPPGRKPFKYDHVARRLVRLHAPRIRRVAEALLIRRRMTGYEVRCLSGLPV